MAFLSPCRCFFYSTLFLVNVFLFFDVLSQSAGFPFDVISSRCFSFLLFCPSRCFYYLTLFPVDVLNFLTFCLRWYFFSTPTFCPRWLFLYSTFVLFSFFSFEVWSVDIFYRRCFYFNALSVNSKQAQWQPKQESAYSFSEDDEEGRCCRHCCWWWWRENMCITELCDSSPCVLRRSCPGSLVLVILHWWSCSRCFVLTFFLLFLFCLPHLECHVKAVMTGLSCLDCPLAILS
jgi:hypothetical protein